MKNLSSTLADPLDLLTVFPIAYFPSVAGFQTDVSGGILPTKSVGRIEFSGSELV